MSNVRVLIVEDEVIIMMHIEDCLSGADYSVVGSAHDANTAFDMLKSKEPDIVLLDITLRGKLSGIEIAKVIREKYNIPFVYLTSHADQATLDEAKKTLPYGYVVKPFNEKNLISTIEMALFRHAAEQQIKKPSFELVNKKLNIALTDKEYSCLIQLTEGLTNKQMAENQFVSLNTIKTHLKNLFLKLNVSNRSSAVRKVREM